MQAYSSDDEQLAALKNWWKQNGKSLLLGILLALAIVFGWKAYESHKRNTAIAASLKYQQVIQALNGLQGSDTDAVAQVQVKALELKNEHGNSSYGQFAALILAKLAVDQKDYAQAEEQLRWLRDQKPDPAMESLVNARLARVLAAQGRHQEALDLLDKEVDGPMQAYYQELRGDVLVSAGERDRARASYQAALTQARETGRNTFLLEVKLADLAVQGD